MTQLQLGRLERVDLRKVWESESGDFTPWLATDENIALLGDAIGLSLEVEAREKPVGPFSADILCKDMSNDSWVVIENQLERTDHVHLGQLLTYAAGLKALTVIWIARQFTEEHRAALDWLNDATGERYSLFGLEVEAWRIGESPAAPKFNVVCKPNDWSRRVSENARLRSGALSEPKRIQLEFWEEFRSFADEHARDINTTAIKPRPQSWLTLGMGCPGAVLAGVASFFDSEKESYDGHEIRVELVLTGPRAIFRYDQLKTIRATIEAKIGESLQWYEPYDRQRRRIYLRRKGDLNDRVRWPDYHRWLVGTLDLFHEVFRPFVLSATDEEAAIANPGEGTGHLTSP